MSVCLVVSCAQSRYHGLSCTQLAQVVAMDEAETMDPDVLAACFDAGIMGIEAPEEFGGAGMGFTAACLAVEEIARVDPAVAVMVDIHNTFSLQP